MLVEIGEVITLVLLAYLRANGIILEDRHPAAHDRSP
jgi:hypothetical protein